jgi:hypothetical protein
VASNIHIATSRMIEPIMQKIDSKLIMGFFNSRVARGAFSLMFKTDSFTHAKIFVVLYIATHSQL